MAFDFSETRLSRMLREALDKIIEDEEQLVAQGMLPDFSMYKEKCGHIRGLKDALRMVEDLTRKLNKE